MAEIQNLISNASPAVIIGLAIAVIVFINTDVSELLDRLKTTQVPLSKHAMLNQQIRLIREATCTFDEREREAIAKQLDGIQKAVQRTYIEDAADEPADEPDEVPA